MSGVSVDLVRSYGEIQATLCGLVKIPPSPPLHRQTNPHGIEYLIRTILHTNSSMPRKYPAVVFFASKVGNDRIWSAADLTVGFNARLVPPRSRDAHIRRRTHFARSALTSNGCSDISQTMFASSTRRDHRFVAHKDGTSDTPGALAVTVDLSISFG